MADGLARILAVLGNAGARKWPVAGGFTLVELLVVLAIIAMVVSTALPSMVALFATGADAQAYNVLSAELTAARALAITRSTYAGVHVQMATDTKPSLSGMCFTAVVWDDPSSFGHNLTLADGFSPRKVTSGMAFGKITPTYINVSAFNSTSLNDANLPDFTNFTILFSPSGALVTHINGALITLDANDAIFNSGSGAAFLWNLPSPQPGEPGVVAVNMFNYVRLRAIANLDRRADYLKTNGTFIRVNAYTGQLMARR